MVTGLDVSFGGGGTVMELSKVSNGVVLALKETLRRRTVCIEVKGRGGKRSWGKRTSAFAKVAW
jgi:hypothetical protein